MAKPAEPKTYAWNFSVIDTASTLVRSASSNDTIGVMMLVDGQIEFWRLGECRVKTKSFIVLFRAIDKLERAT